MSNDEKNSISKDISPTVRRGRDFWMVIIANLTVDLLSALDLTAISTALPTIVNHLHGSDFIWAGSAYSIASTAIVPLCGGLVSLFGRKSVLLCFIIFFALGSAICGAAQNMSMFITGRAIQGLGGGGCMSVTEIIYADLVPLPERGKFLGIVASVWAFSCAIGPPIGGALANSGAWRYLFFLNLPLCGLALIFEMVFLRIHVPRDSFWTKFWRMDWVGTITIVGSTTAVMLGLTWGGIQYLWISTHVLVPLVLGCIGIVAFFVIEARCSWIKEPTLPWYIVSNRTTVSGYLATFFHGIASMAVIYYLPVYFQASKGASAIRSGIYLFGLGLTIAAFATLNGLSVEIFKRYRPQNYVGWVITIVGFCLLSRLDADSTKAQFVGYQVLVGVGMGMIWIGTQFPILAPLPFSNNAHALAFFTFVRCLAQSWGIVIGGTILQNVLHKRLPSSFVSSLPHGTQLAYAVIPEIATLPEPLKHEVQVAFASATLLIWQVMIGISGIGLLTCLLMREEEMRKSMDQTWGLKREQPGITVMDSEQRI